MWKNNKRNHYFESLAYGEFSLFVHSAEKRERVLFRAQHILQGSWTQFYEFINILISMYIHLTSFALRTAQHSMVDSISSLLITLLNLNILVSRRSGDVIRRTGMKNFNAVSHNRARPYFRIQHGRGEVRARRVYLNVHSVTGNVVDTE